MPTALQRSRDILASGVARVRSGLLEYGRRQNEVGPEIAVEPFDARNVSTPAGLIKLGTTIAAAQRKRANLLETRSKAALTGDLEREKTRAEIARIRAQTEAELRPDVAKPAAVVMNGEFKGMTPAEANVHLSGRRLELSRANAANRELRVRNTAAARARLTELDKKGGRIERDTAVHAARQTNRLEHLFERANSTDPKVSAVALKAIDITPEEWENAKNGRDGDYRPALLKVARANLRARVIARARMNVENYYRPLRDQLEATIQRDIDGGVADPVLDETGIIEVDDQGNPVQ